jgi:hypothetical protein
MHALAATGGRRSSRELEPEIGLCVIRSDVCWFELQNEDGAAFGADRLTLLSQGICEPVEVGLHHTLRTTNGTLSKPSTSTSQLNERQTDLHGTRLQRHRGGQSLGSRGSCSVVLIVQVCRDV